MKVSITMAVAFRQPTGDEVARTDDALPRYEVADDAHFAAWHDGGLPLMLRRLWGMTEDGESLKTGDVAMRLGMELWLVESLSRHLVFSDTPFAHFRPERCTYSHEGGLLVCRYESDGGDS